VIRFTPSEMGDPTQSGKTPGGTTVFPATIELRTVVTLLDALNPPPPSPPEPSVLASLRVMVRLLRSALTETRRSPAPWPAVPLPSIVEFTARNGRSGPLT
jgi:hypothetical protein